MQFVSIAIGGIFGAALRYYLSVGVARNMSGFFPWPTFIVNFIGSFFIGFLWGLLEHSNASTYVKSFTFVGLLGSFTTFSTFSLDIFNLLRKGDYSAATLYWLLSTILGVLAVGLGYFLSKKVLHLINMWF
jgi:CrcB protein